MNIKPLNNASVYSANENGADRKASKKSDMEQASKASSKPVDRVEISDEAKLASTLDSTEIREKIKSGFYDNPEVLMKVARELSKELAIAPKE